MKAAKLIMFCGIVLSWLAVCAACAKTIYANDDASDWDNGARRTAGEQVSVQSSDWNTGTALADSPSKPVQNTAVHNPHDVDRLSNGHTLITDGGYTGGKQAGDDSKVLEVDSAGNVVWSFATGLNFAHGAERLGNGNTLISDTGHDRVIEVDTGGSIVWNSQNAALSDGSTLKYPNEAHWLTPGNNLLITDRDNHRVIVIKRDDATHLSGPHNADRLASGNLIIADSGNNRILEVTPAGEVAWEYRPSGTDCLAWPRDADRLASGNTLIVDSEHYRLVEVTPDKQVVWQHGDLELPYDADRLPNGNTLISKSLTEHVIEVDPAGANRMELPTWLGGCGYPIAQRSQRDVGHSCTSSCAGRGTLRRRCARHHLGARRL